MKDFKVKFQTVYTIHPVGMTRAERDATYLPFIKVFINNLKITDPVDMSNVNTFGGLCQVLNHITTKENMVKYIQKHDHIHTMPGGRTFVAYDNGGFTGGISFSLNKDGNTSIAFGDLYSQYKRTFFGPDLFFEAQKRFTDIAHICRQNSK